MMGGGWDGTDEPERPDRWDGSTSDEDAPIKENKMMDPYRLYEIAKAAEDIKLHMDALAGTRAHRLGCTCGASNDGVHSCKSFMKVYERLKILFPIPEKEHETNIVRALKPGDTIIG